MSFAVKGLSLSYSRSLTILRGELFGIGQGQSFVFAEVRVRAAGATV